MTEAEVRELDKSQILQAVIGSVSFIPNVMGDCWRILNRRLSMSHFYFKRTAVAAIQRMKCRVKEGPQG